MKRELTIKTDPVRKRERSDNTRQLKIVAKVGYMTSGTFHELERHEVKILKDGEIYRVTDKEYSDIRNSVSEDSFRLFFTKQTIKRVILQAIEDSEELSADLIHRRLYKIENDREEKKKVGNWNDFLAQWGIAVNNIDEIEELEKEIKFMQEEKGFVTDEDMGDLASGIQLTNVIHREQERILKMDYNTRYKNGHFDRNNIFDVFGYLWSENPLNGDPYVAKSYRSLILQLNDYRYNALPSQSVKDFDTEWIDGFFTYLREKGFPNVRLKGYDPFNIHEYYDRLVNADREMYKVQAFKKVVKHFKRYLSLLKEYDLIHYPKEVNMISAEKYLSRDVTRDNFTRREFSLSPDEYNKMAHTDFKNDRLNLARDMFIIMVQGGGFRTNEIFQYVKVHNNEITVYRPKIKEVVTNPIWGHLADVIERHNGNIPKDLLPVEDYRSALKEIAQQLDFDRVIVRPNTTIHDKRGNEVTIEDQVEEIVLMNVFSPLFARKTIVRYLSVVKSMKDEDIMEFVTISSEKTLKHYKNRMEIVEKFKLIE